MRVTVSLISSIAAAVILASACAEAPVTDRQQLILIDEQQANEMGAEAWKQIKSEKEISKNDSARRRVERIGKKLAAVSGAPNLNWEFEVFADPTPNAFALPGGKIGVHSGLFDVARNEEQLAAVLAHEVGHVVARHPSEQISQNAAIQAALSGAGLTEGVIGQVAQLATGVGTLSFSRQHEAEADRIGLQYMAKAGYDPRAAIELWRNMKAAMDSEGRPPAFLSTHPYPEDRIEAIEEALPEVMPIYRRNA